MYGSLNVSTSGLIAQRTRLTAISANIANAKTLLNEKGEYEPFRRRDVHLAPGDPATGNPLGVHVAAIQLDQAPLRPQYEPHSPYADAKGYVYYPNVDTVVEQMNAMEATRAYEANISAIEATKSMISVALELLG